MRPYLSYCYLLLLMSTLLSGCLAPGGEPVYEDAYTTNTPKVADLVGTYELSNETLTHNRAIFGGNPYRPGEELKARDGSKASVHRLVLRADGSFTAVNIPKWAYSHPDGWVIISFRSGEGQWKIKGSRLQFCSDNVNLASALKSVRTELGLAHWLQEEHDPDAYLLGKRAPYAILFNLAIDPDSDEAVIFRKRRA